MLFKLSSPWGPGVWLLLIVAAAVSHLGCSPSAAPPAPSVAPSASSSSASTIVTTEEAPDEPKSELSKAESPKSRSVKLVVHFGDGKVRTYESLPWTKGDSVLAILDKAETGEEPLSYSQSGSGETAFVDEISGIKNEGTGTGKKNWLFWVNDKFADRSAGDYELQDGDEVVWKFTEWPVK